MAVSGVISRLRLIMAWIRVAGTRNSRAKRFALSLSGTINYSRKVAPGWTSSSRFFFALIGLALARQKQRAGRVAQDVFGGRAEHHLDEAAVAVGPDEQGVGRVLADVGDDLL